MFSTIGYACAAVILGLFAIATIALDLHTVIRSARAQRDGTTASSPHLRLISGTSPNHPRGDDGVSQSAA